MGFLVFLSLNILAGVKIKPCKTTELSEEQAILCRETMQTNIITSWMREHQSWAWFYTKLVVRVGFLVV